MLLDFQNDVKNRMMQCVKLFEINIDKLRTGKASPTVLDGIHIEYFGSLQAIKNISNISIEDFRTLKINIFDKSVSNLIYKAINNSNLGLQVNIVGDIIRVIFPVLTEERRKNLIKLVRGEAEFSRIAVRNIRRSMNDKIKKFVKQNIIGKDDEYSTQIIIQNQTDKYIKEIDLILLNKEKELMTF
ncbi:Ribosome-recycling factor [Buchnera aphidicola (Eriosoma lanigerum)]|uniref:ribosome recycling factor n=1 Tax=Buchnera aphidicola TaxID=9 RepID=UPI0034645DDB